MNSDRSWSHIVMLSRTRQGGGRRARDVQLAKLIWTVEVRIIQPYMADSVYVDLPLTGRFGSVCRQRLVGIRHVHATSARSSAT